MLVCPGCYDIILEYCDISDILMNFSTPKKHHIRIWCFFLPRTACRRDTPWTSPTRTKLAENLWNTFERLRATWISVEPRSLLVARHDPSTFPKIGNKNSNFFNQKRVLVFYINIFYGSFFVDGRYCLVIRIPLSQIFWWFRKYLLVFSVCRKSRKSRKYFRLFLHTENTS